MSKYIVIFGNPIDGLQVVGPFDSHEAAERVSHTLDEDWWITELLSTEEILGG